MTNRWQIQSYQRLATFQEEQEFDNYAGTVVLEEVLHAKKPDTLFGLVYFGLAQNVYDIVRARRLS